MPEPINLRQARKATRRAHDEQRAGQNRVTFGQNKASKELSQARTNLAARLLDGARLTTADDA